MCPLGAHQDALDLDCALLVGQALAHLERTQLDVVAVHHAVVLVGLLLSLLLALELYGNMVRGAGQAASESGTECFQARKRQLFKCFLQVRYEGMQIDAGHGTGELDVARAELLTSSSSASLPV